LVTLNYTLKSNIKLPVPTASNGALYSRAGFKHGLRRRLERILRRDMNSQIIPRLRSRNRRPVTLRTLKNILLTIPRRNPGIHIFTRQDIIQLKVPPMTRTSSSRRDKRLRPSSSRSLRPKIIIPLAIIPGTLRILAMRRAEEARVSEQGLNSR
jgi:hypothetical protein